MPLAGRVHYLEALPPPQARHRGTLVLLHAFPLNARMWEQQLGLAGQGWHVIAPHVRGADGGDDNRPVNGIDDYAADLIDLFDALHIEDAVVCGLSMGGYLTFALLRLAPNYIRGLVLADTKSQADTLDGLAARRSALELVHTKGVQALADTMIPKLLGATTRERHPAVERRVRDLIEANSRESVAGAIRALMSRPDSTPLLASIRVPTLIVVGDEDTVTPPSAAEEMRSRIPGAELVRLPECGHLSNLEQPDRFNTVVAHFIDHRV